MPKEENPKLMRMMKKRTVCQEEVKEYNALNNDVI
jgi:hypothetical protein